MRQTLYILLLGLFSIPMIAAEPMDTIQLATMMENRQYDDVIQITTRELDRFPKSGAMYYYRSMALAYQKNLPEALENIHHAIRYPKEVPLSLPDLYVLRAGMYILLQDTTAALSDYTMAIKRAGKHPRNVRYYKQRADAHAYFEQYAEAASDYHMACEMDPENASLQVELARYLAMSGRVAEGRQLLEDLCALHPEQIEAPRLLAVLLCYIEEDYHAAVDWTITALIRRYIANHSIGDADILFLASAMDYAYVYQAISKEIERYDAAELYGLRDLFYLIRGELLRERGYAEDALADLDSVSIFSIPSQYDEAIESEKIQCYLQLNNWEEVIDRTTKLIKQNPDSSPYYAARSEAYYYSERYESAETDLKRLYNRDPSMHNTLKLGILYYNWKRYSDAILYFSRLLEQTEVGDEASRYGHLMRGESYLNLQDTLLAYRDFETVLETDTTYRNTVRHYALYRLGRTDEALRWVEQLIREYPEARNYYDAACLYAQEQDTTRALQFLETALRWGYESPRQILRDNDLNNLRNHPYFQSLVEQYVTTPNPKTKK